MTQKDKARELVEKFHYQICNDCGLSESDSTEFAAKQCAIICVEEISKMTTEECWTTKKPKFKEECVFVTANWFKDHWEYNIWEIKKIDTGEGWYLGLCDHSGEEWGDLADLKVDYYKIINPPSLITK